ncbi:GGIII-like transmembrane region-containing protein [Mechercharimyces sp. CAU 1602]|uniref:GGIII-like transmembrane region-containing protein n=1 Tax=Mechercharimyces sp. CAU 1602 TaxID=2973933 RepID=UPI0021625FCD|nr:GGIII-like transmembrane region-containing protein [Mechercharimyces sp. CAU 1602]MCS1350069.1 hypothetical protein [Mechercharimyces sp. CAU 1602]
MQKYKRFLFIILLIFPLMLSGCIDADTHITVHKDGSGEYEFKVLLTQSMLSDYVDESFVEIKQAFIDEGFNVAPLEEDGKKGFLATKEVDNIADEPPFEDMDKFKGKLSSYLDPDSADQLMASTNSAMLPMGATSSLTVPPLFQNGYQLEQSFLFYTFRINTEADLTDMGGDGSLLSDLIMDQVNLRLLFTLPVEPQEHNADTVVDDGKTLIWNVEPGKKNPVAMTLQVPNPFGWIVLGAGGLLLIIGIVVLIIFVSKRKKAS